MSDKPASILVVDDEAAMRLGLREVLAREGYAVELAKDGDEACRRLETGGLDAVVTDLRMPGKDGLAVLAKAKERDPGLIVFVITAYGDVPTAVEAMKAGAADFIMKPFKIDDVRSRIRTQLLKRAATEEAKRPRAPLSAEEIAEVKKDFPEIVGQSPAWIPALRLVRKVAPTDSTILVVGETGTGKELVARAIHRLSKRKEGRFVATTLGGIPETLYESELFGHARGAFTGAVKAKEGLFEAAEKGTFFLDEVGDIPLALQPKLLRAIQEREVVRLGETQPRKIDVRLVAATWRDLSSEIQAKRFREDLYFRLNVVTVRLPPLRERLDDLPLLLERFLKVQGEKVGRQLRTTESALERLRAHRWPGNVRELGHVAEKLAIYASSDEISAEDVTAALAS